MTHPTRGLTYYSYCIADPCRETNFAAASGAEDALVFRGPGLSMSASTTAQHIYHGLAQGRDVVVPGIVNKVSLTNCLLLVI